jgi:hypothetical protein
MKIAVYDTGHEIADTVASALMDGLPNSTLIEANSPFPFADVHIGYGILRKTGDVFSKCKSTGQHWFELDRGYFNPGHFDGYYRISYKGTQAKYDANYPTIDSGIELKPIQKHDKSKPVLVCPPTDAVKQFYGISEWIADGVIRNKGDANPINWDDYRAVITFNSSVGWQALQQGIPCLSDPQNSVVGSYYNTKSIDEAIEKFHSMPREPLFNFMRNHQFTLAEIEQGQAWDLINHYLN